MSSRLLHIKQFLWRKHQLIQPFPTPKFALTCCQDAYWSLSPAGDNYYLVYGQYLNKCDAYKGYCIVLSPILENRKSQQIMQMCKSGKTKYYGKDKITSWWKVRNLGVLNTWSWNWMEVEEKEENKMCEGKGDAFLVWNDP